MSNKKVIYLPMTALLLPEKGHVKQNESDKVKKLLKESAGLIGFGVTSVSIQLLLLYNELVVIEAKLIYLS